MSKRKADSVEDITYKLCQICIDEMSTNGGYGWYIDNEEKIKLEIDPNEIPAEFKHDSQDNRTAMYTTFRNDIKSGLEIGFNVKWSDSEFSENDRLLNSLDKLGSLKQNGVMNFQLVRAPFDVRKEIAEQLFEGCNRKGISLPDCAPDRGVSKDLTSKLVGHEKEIANVGILYDNATSLKQSGKSDSSFFPMNDEKFIKTGFATGFNSGSIKTCICIMGYIYSEGDKQYRTYKGTIIEIVKGNTKTVSFNGIKGGGNYFEPTIEKLAADMAYNGGTTTLTSMTRMLCKYSGDRGQRIMAGGGTRDGIISTLTTGDGNMFDFALNGIKFEDKTDYLHFPVIYGKMRTLQSPDQSITIKSGPQSLIISAWPDRGTLSEEQIQINKRIANNQSELDKSRIRDSEIIVEITSINEFIKIIEEYNESGRRINPKTLKNIQEEFERIINIGKKYGVVIQQIKPNSEVSKIKQIHDALLTSKEDGRTISAILKNLLEQHIYDIRKRQDIIVEEIEQAKELFTSYIKGEEEDELESIASSSAPSSPYSQPPSPFSFINSQSGMMSSRAYPGPFREFEYPPDSPVAHYAEQQQYKKRGGIKKNTNKKYKKRNKTLAKEKNKRKTYKRK
jgi:hypothetical protein